GGARFGEGTGSGGRARSGQVRRREPKASGGHEGATEGRAQRGEACEGHQVVVAPIHIDDLSEPRLPFALRALNALGGPIARWVLSLDPEDLLAAASARTGLTDYGDPSFREPLAVLLQAFEHDADLSAV